MKKYLRIMLLNMMFLVLFLESCMQQGSIGKQDAKKEDSKTTHHAFLLGSETLYCLDLPTDWIADFSDTRHLAFYWIDKQEECICNFSVGKSENDLGRRAQVKEEYDAVFYFANGMVGLRKFYQQDGGISDYGKDEKYYQVEKIFSDDMNEWVNVRMEVKQYERNHNEIEQVVHASYFEKNTIGIPCTEPLESRELVYVHTNNAMFALQVMVPRGIAFYEGEYSWFGDGSESEDYQLAFYFDEEREEYVRICSDSQGYICENERLVWEQVQFDNSRITEGGLLVRHFQFEEESEEYFWFPLEKVVICVSVKNKEVRNVVKKVVESIQFD